MPQDSDPKKQTQDERDIARRRDEFLAEARGERKPGNVIGGADPRLMGLGFQFIVATLIALYAGMWLDSKLRTSPWFTLIGGMVGAGAGFYSMYAVMVAENKKYDKEDQERRDKQK